MKTAARTGNQKPTKAGGATGRAYPLLEISQRRLALVVAMTTATGPLDVDFVHDLRTHSRRLTEVVGILEAVLPRQEQERMAEAVRRLRRSAGALRDLDVITESLGHLTVPPTLQPVIAELQSNAPAQRVKLEAALRKVLKTAPLQRTLQQLTATLESLKNDHAKKIEKRLLQALQKRIAKRRKQMRRQWSATGSNPSADVLHLARIAAKKYRYALELLSEVSPAGTTKLLAFLKQAQSLLGDHHDADVLRATIDRAIRKDAHSSELLSHCEAFVAGMKADQQRREAAFLKLKTRFRGAS